MVPRLLCKIVLLAAVVLLLSGERGTAQEKIGPPAIVAPKGTEPAPGVDMLSGQEIDRLIEKAFGKDSAESKRPIRVSLPEIGLIAADKATISPDGLSVRFTPGSIGLVNAPGVANGINSFRGDAIVVAVGSPVKTISELQDRQGSTVEVHHKNAIILFEPEGSFTTQVRTKTQKQTVMVQMQEKIRVKKNAAQPAPTQEPIEMPVQNPGPPIPAQNPKTSNPAMNTVTMSFKLKIDPKAPLTDLLPTPAKTPVGVSHWSNEDLAKIPELTFGEPISKELPKIKAMEETAHVLARINHLNQKKTDGFMLALIAQRPDLRGLPFLMGTDCRTSQAQATIFANVTEVIHPMLGQAKNGKEPRGLDPVAAFVADLHPGVQAGGDTMGLPSGTPDQYYRAVVAALTQILMPEDAKLRTSLAKNLATIPHADATKALAKLAIFSPEEEVRAAAIEGLKLRREKDYTDVLMQGFRYPLPAVSKRAAEALVKLERKDLLANLVEVLESPDPRLPIIQKREGKNVTFVRELVRVNHHRNCLLCHAPGNTENTPEGVLTVAVPLPGEPLAKPSEDGGYNSMPVPTPDIVVRLDMTYLRQDFSLMMPVADAHPWPEMQRFDFLVRTRTLTSNETQTYPSSGEQQEPGRLSPYHRAALFALRELTGLDTEPNAAAWRKLLQMSRN